MSKMSAEGLNHYAVVYGLNYRKLKDNIMGHQSTQWKMMEECFRDISNISAGYEWAKGYCRAKFHTTNTSCITEFKTIKKTGLCYNWRTPHSVPLDNSRNSINKFHTENIPQNYSRNNCTEKFCNNKGNNNIFPMGTLSFPASQPIRSGNDMLVGMETIKCFFLGK